jgi:hypothetical protein
MAWEGTNKHWGADWRKLQQGEEWKRQWGADWRKAKTEERKQCWWNNLSTPPSSFASSGFQEQTKKEKRERDREREDWQTRNQEGEDIVRPELIGRHLRLHLYPAAAPGKLSVSLTFCICVLIHKAVHANIICLALYICNFNYSCTVLSVCEVFFTNRVTGFGQWSGRATGFNSVLKK